MPNRAGKDGSGATAADGSMVQHILHLRSLPAGHLLGIGESVGIGVGGLVIPQRAEVGPLVPVLDAIAVGVDGGIDVVRGGGAGRAEIETKTRQGGS
jgi:hypothetical protein